MKKFMMDVKATVGTAPKTEDKDFEEKVKAMKDVDKAILEYTSSVEKMKSAAKTMSQALENVSKAFASLTTDPETPEAMKGVATSCADAVKRIHDEDLAAYIKALDDETASPMKNIKAKITELKTVESARNKVMAEYDTYREAVTKKEKEYEKKGKDISESKGHSDDVAKRDAAKKEFDEKNDKYKEKSDAITKERLETFLNAMKGFSADTAKYFAAVEKNIASVSSAAEKVKL